MERRGQHRAGCSDGFAPVSACRRSLQCRGFGWPDRPGWRAWNAGDASFGSCEGSKSVQQAAASAGFCVERKRRWRSERLARNYSWPTARIQNEGLRRWRQFQTGAVLSGSPRALLDLLEDGIGEIAVHIM